MYYFCGPLGCLSSPVSGSESVHDSAVVFGPSRKWGFSALPIALDCHLDRFPCEQTGCKHRTLCMLNEHNGLHCGQNVSNVNKQLFPRHFRTACSGYTLFLWPVHTNAEIKCALSSKLICLEVSWQCQSGVINNIAGDFFLVVRIPIDVNCSHFVFLIGFL